MIIAKDLSKTFYIKQKKNFWNKPAILKKEAVVKIDMEIPKGKIVGLLGVNGAGKTTTIKMLSTMLEPTCGAINIDEIDAVKYPMKAKTRINIITGGERNIYWRLTARENLQYFGSLYGLSGRDLKTQIDACLKIVNMEKNADIPVEKYSKGMKQRLQIARGLINDPSYLFLDEPTLGLDIIISRELKAYIKNLALQNNKGILLTTHYIREAEELCDYIYVIDQGKILAQGSTQMIKSSYSRKFVTQIMMLNCNEIFLAEMRKIPNVLEISFSKDEIMLEVISTRDIVQEIITLTQKNECQILKIQSLDPSLEDTLFSIMQYNKNKIE